MYVQDVLRKQLSEEVWQVLYQSTGHLYVCGGMNMAQDVVHTIQEILVNRLGINFSQAGEYLDQLKVWLVADFTTARTYLHSKIQYMLISRNTLFRASANLVKGVFNDSSIS